MYKRKEIVIVIIIFALLIGIYYFNSRPSKEKVENITEVENSSIEILIKGEVIKETTLNYQKPLTYGVLFLRIENILNQYSDLSNFNLDTLIVESMTIVIPSTDVGNAYQKDALIDINNASIEDLKKLPKIGEKRSQKIIDHIKAYGKIKTWEELWVIIGVSKEAKELIQQQAFLQ